MEKFIIILGVLFLATACGNSENYASVPDDHSEPQASTAERDIKDIVAVAVEQSEKRIGNKKRREVDVSDSVGKADLGKTKPSFITSVEVTTVVVEGKKKKEEDEEDEEQKVVSEEKPKRPEMKVANKENCDEFCRKKAGTAPKLDILFYMDRRDSNCATDFLDSALKDGFLKHLSGWDWQLSFSYYTETAELMPLEFNNGRPHNTANFKIVRDYVLSKGEYPENKSRRLFLTTLKPSKYLMNHRDNDDTNYTPDSNKYVNNPLVGLDHILVDNPEGFAKSSSQVVVLLFGNQFPYYSTESWKKFFNKHPNVNIVSVSPRNANISNFLHVVEKHGQFDVLSECSASEALKKVKKD